MQDSPFQVVNSCQASTSLTRSKHTTTSPTVIGWNPIYGFASVHHSTCQASRVVQWARGLGMRPRILLPLGHRRDWRAPRQLTRTSGGAASPSQSLDSLSGSEDPESSSLSSTSCRGPSRWSNPLIITCESFLVFSQVGTDPCLNWILLTDPV